MEDYMVSYHTARQKRLLESIYFFGHRLAEAALSYLPEGVISIPDAAA